MRSRAQASHDQVEELARRAEVLGAELDALRTYASGRAFRMALNTRIRAVAAETATDSAEIARRFALQLFVSRLFEADPDSWTVTGGTALQYRTQTARATADLDLASAAVITDLAETLGAAGRRRPGEHGDFLVEVSATGPGMFTGKITYMLDGSRLAVAKLDVVSGRDDLPAVADFLVPAPVVTIDDARMTTAIRTIRVAAHVGDKVAAMYELHGPAGTSPSTRSHDLADIVIMSRACTVDAEELRAAVRAQELRRGVRIPAPLTLPSSEWRRSFVARSATAAMQAGLGDVDEALLEADRFVGAVLDGRVGSGTWDPDRRCWQQP